MLIADIDHHEVILSKVWMNQNEILLNMQNDVIVFFESIEYFYFDFFDFAQFKAFKLIAINFAFFNHSD